MIPVFKPSPNDQRQAQQYLDELEQARKKIHQNALMLNASENLLILASEQEAQQLFTQAIQLGNTLNKYYPALVHVPPADTADPTPDAEVKALTSDEIDETERELERYLYGMRTDYLKLYELTQNLTSRHQVPPPAPKPAPPPQPPSPWPRRIVLAGGFLALILVSVFYIYPEIRDYWHERQITQAYERGQQAFQDQAWAKAIKEFGYAYREGPYKDSGQYLADSYHEAIRAGIAQQDWETARRYATQYIELGINVDRARDDLRDTYYLPGKAYFDNGQYDEARPELLALYEYDHNAGRPVYLDTGEMLFAAYYLPAQAAINDEDWAGAYALLDPLYELSDEYEKTRALLGEASYELGWQAHRAGDSSAAQTYFTRLYKVYPDYVEDLLNQQQWENVRAVLDVWEKISPLSPALEEIYQRSYYDEAVFTTSQEPVAWEQVEMLLQALLDRPAQLSDNLDPQVFQLLTESYTVRAETLINESQWSEARAMLDPALALPASTNAYYRETQTLYRETYYRPAAQAVEAGEWQTALTHLEPLYELDSRFKDAPSLLSKAYYEMGIAAYRSSDFSNAQNYLEKVVKISPDYADTSTILADIYYTRAQEILADAQDITQWENARDLLTALIGLYPNYRDAETLLRETYYVPALNKLAEGVSTLDAPTCQVARAMLFDMFELDADFDPETDLLPDSKFVTYKDSRTLLHESYYCEASAALAANDLQTALDPLRTLFALSPYYKDAQGLYTQTLYDLGRTAFEQQDWLPARGYLSELIGLEPSYRDAFILLRDAYYIPAQRAFEAGEWETARDDLRPILIGSEDQPALDPYYKDTRALFLETYYQPGTQALANENWATARTELKSLIEVVARLDQISLGQANYQPENAADAQTLLREAYYRPGKTALDSSEWEAARAELTALLTLVSTYENVPIGQANYLDAQTLLRESYYWPGRTALNNGEWEAARAELTALLTLISTYENVPIGQAVYQDAQTLLRESYYRPGKVALDGGEWETARTEFMALITLISDWDNVSLAQAVYQDTQNLVRETYYRPAVIAFEAQDWQFTRTELNDLFDLIAQIENVAPEKAEFKDAQDLLRRSYYVPGQAALLAQNWTVARNNFHQLIEIDPAYQDTNALLVEAYLTPGQLALASQDWGLARQNCEMALTLDAANDDARTCLFEAHYQPGQQAFAIQDWETARWHLGALVDYGMNTLDIGTMYRDTYIKPVENLTASGDAQAARQALEAFRQAYPDDTQTYNRLLLMTYDEVFQNAIQLEDWYTAAEQYLVLLATNPADATINRILLEKPALKRALAQHSLRAWIDNGLYATLPGTLSGHSAAVNTVAVSAGTTLVSGSTDGTIRVWRTGKPPLIIWTNTGWIYRLALAPDGRWIASTANDSLIYIWDAQTGQQVATLSDHQAWVSDVAFSPDGHWLASASDDQTVRIWSADDWGAAPVVLQNTDRVTAVAFAPDGRLLASALADGTIALWDTSTQNSTASVNQGSFVSKIVFHPDGGSFVAVGHDPVVRIWATTGQLLNSLEGHQDWVRSASFNGDGTLLATVGADNQLCLWDLTIGRLVGQSEDNLEQPLDVSFSLDSQRLMVSNSDGTILIWSVENQ